MNPAEVRERLREQREHLAPLLEISPSATVITDLDSAVVAWNSAAERLFGYTAEEATGRNLDDLVATMEELHEDAVSFSHRTAARDQVRAITRRTRKDGTVVDVELRAAPLLSEGEPVGTLGVYHDITELRRQKQYYEALLDVSPAAIVAIDPQDHVILWNPAAERLFGYTAEEAVGRNIDDLVANDQQIRREAESLNRQAEEGPIRGTTRRTRKDGSRVDVEVLGAPIHVGGERVGRYAIYLDVSELQRRKQYYEGLLEVSPTAIITIDPQENVTSWNPAAERLFGYTPQEAIGRHVDDLVAKREDIRDEALEVSRRIATEEVRLTTRRTRKDGSLVDVQVTGAPIHVGGELVGMYGLFHDVSELQEQRRYLQAVVELSPTAIVVTDLQARVTSWNPAAEKLFGYPTEEALGRHLDDLVATRPEIREEALGYSRAALRGERVREFARRTRKDGTLVDVELVSEPIVVGDQTLGFLAIYHDITELQHQKQYYASVLELSPTAIVTVDETFHVTSWNPAAEELFGYTPEEALGRNIDDLVANSPDLRKEAAEMNEAGAAGRRAQAITRRTRKDGSLVDVEIIAGPVYVAGEWVAYSVIYHDVSELQRARRDAEAATRAKSAFLATMSHEIRTPLNAVIGMTGLLLDTQLTAEQRGFAEIVRTSGDALLAVINDILDFSKIEAGRLELERAPFDLRGCLESALELVAAAVAKKQLDLAYDMDESVPPAVIGDVTRVRQIVINLLTNAVKFTEQGEVVLTVRAERPDPADENRVRLHLAVRDTGIGIPEARMEGLFESFSQIDPSTTRRYGGTGLGLAISKLLAEAMGGTMWAESRVGEGSTFHFTIDADASPAPARRYERRGSPQLEGRRVLIVDDNATNRQILSRQTQAWGMLARATGSPDEALAWVRQGDPFDVAILDMQMPDMDGLTLAREIRSHRDARALPLVLLTSLGRVEDTGAFAAHLTKPIRPSQLYDVLLDVFDSQPERELRVEPDRVEPDRRPVASRPLRILVVEDNAVNQQLALLMLEKIGYRADVAANGVEALEALERQSYDVVLMDVEMPEMDGLEATRRIHQRWSRQDRPRIIAVTANAMEGERDVVLAAGMDDYIAKPIRIEELTQALARSTPLVESESSPFDPAVLQALVTSFGDRGAESVAGLIDTFLGQGPSLVASLRQGIERSDSDAARRAAHTLKSNAAAFGAVRLADLSGELEARAVGSPEDAAELFPRIEAEFRRVEAALQRARHGLVP